MQLLGPNGFEPLLSGTNRPMLLRQPSEGDVRENSKQPTMPPQQQAGTPDVEKASMPGTDITLQLSTRCTHSTCCPKLNRRTNRAGTNMEDTKRDADVNYAQGTCQNHMAAAGPGQYNLKQPSQQTMRIHAAFHGMLGRCCFNKFSSTAFQHQVCPSDCGW